MSIKQGKNESLKEFLEIFNQIELKIKGIQNAIAIHSILVTLQLGDFPKLLAKRLAKNIIEQIT